MSDTPDQTPDEAEPEPAETDSPGSDPGPDAGSPDAPKEEVQPAEPDHPDTLAALEDIGARLDTNRRGKVWRVFFYEKNGDDDVAHIHGLSDLKEVWLLGTRVTKSGAEGLRERLPEVTVYY